MTRSIPLATRRVRQTLSRFENGAALLAAIARQGVTGRPEELVFRVDGRTSITVPNRRGARVPVYEIFVEDEYHLDWFASDLGERPVVVDIGAHVGCFSVAFARRHPEASIWSYEASPSTAAYLDRNIRANGLEDRVHGQNLAVQAVGGVLELADNGAGSGHNGVLHLPGAARTVSVQSTSMADVLQAAGPAIDVVKIDTEGGEYDMVLGSDTADWAGVRRVVLEYHNLPGHSWEQLATFFSAAGLRLVRREEFAERLGMAWFSRDDVPGDAPAEPR